MPVPKSNEPRRPHLRRGSRDPEKLRSKTIRRARIFEAPSPSASQTPYESPRGRPSPERAPKRNIRRSSPRRSERSTGAISTSLSKIFPPVAYGHGSPSGLSRDHRARHQSASTKEPASYRDLDLTPTQKPALLGYGDVPHASSTFAPSDMLARLSIEQRNELLLEIVKSQGILAPEDVHAKLPRRDQERLFMEYMKSRGLQPFGLEKLNQSTNSASDPAVVLQVLTRSQLQHAIPLHDHGFRPGDILKVSRKELTSDVKARFGQSTIIASDHGLTSDKQRPVLIGTIDYTTSLATGWELGTRDGMGLDSVRYKASRQTYYHVMNIDQHDYSPVQLKNRRTVPLNRTGRPSLLIEDVPSGITWSRLSHMHSLSRVSFRILTSQTFMGRLTPESRLRVLDDEATAATIRANYERSMIEQSQGEARLRVPAIHMVAVSSASGEEWEPREEVPYTMSIYHPGQMKKKRKRSSGEDGESQGTSSLYFDSVLSCYDTGMDESTEVSPNW